jgi:hypothetical protein
MLPELPISARGTSVAPPSPPKFIVPVRLVSRPETRDPAKS